MNGAPQYGGVDCRNKSITKSNCRSPKKRLTNAGKQKLIFNQPLHKNLDRFASRKKHSFGHTDKVMRKIIEVEDLVKKYGDFEAVKGISFSVNEGEIFGLLGPNGAGKSTTLEIIETLRQKTSGRVLVDGLNLDEQPNEIKKIIGVQLQTAGYYPGLNLTELIHLFSGLYNRQIDVTEFLNLVNLKDKAKAKFKELSGGQKQRFSIATTLNQSTQHHFPGRADHRSRSAGSPQSLGPDKRHSEQRHNSHYDHSLYG